MSADEITSVISGYTPIGVVAIPASHDVYGDGTCGVVSLAEMNYSIPDTGSSSYQDIYWGGLDIDTSLTNYDVVNLVDGTTAGMGYLSSDQFTGNTSLDGVTRYLTTYNNIPSPYNADGSRNEAYYTTAYSTTNALSDFDGVGNTAVLTELATGQSDWKTASTINNYSWLTDCYPAACCCWRFHTEGTEQGQWYLPACGELGYVINRITTINETITKIKSVYTSVVAVVVDTSGGYWTSAECDARNARYLFTYNGCASGYGKASHDFFARAFLRL